MKVICEFPMKGHYQVSGQFTCFEDNTLSNSYRAYISVENSGKFEVDLEYNTAKEIVCPVEKIVTNKYKGEINSVSDYDWSLGKAYKIDLADLTTSCNHQWKVYNGLATTYEFCETCDEKRKL